MSQKPPCLFKWHLLPTNFSAQITRAKLFLYRHIVRRRTTLTSNESFFSTILHQSRRVSYDEFALNFGGIDRDVVEMLEGEEARNAIRDARERMEAAGNLPSGKARLRQQIEFGNFPLAPELERGEVAAVDGTFALPLQLYSA